MTLRDKLKFEFIAIIILAVVVALIAYPQAVSKIPPVYNALKNIPVFEGPFVDVYRPVVRVR